MALRIDCLSPLLRLPALLLGWMVLCCGLAEAQTFDLKRYTAENGLPEAYVYCVEEDAQGFLYAGTGTGLFRFNGLSFEHLNRAAGLAEDFCTHMYRDRKDRIWVGHFEGGLSIMEHGKIRSVLDSNLLGSAITGIAEDGRGNIWVGAQREGLVRVDTAFKAKHFPGPLEDYMVQCISFIPGGQLLVGTDAGLLLFDIGADGPVLDRKIQSIPTTRITAITPQGQRGGIWIGTEDEGLWEYKPGTSTEGDQVQQFGPAQGFPFAHVHAVLEEANARVWVGAAGNGFLIYDDDDAAQRMQRVRPSTAMDTLAKEIVRAIYRNRFGQIWLATYGHGLVSLSEQTFSSIYLHEKTELRIVGEIEAILEDHNGDFWVGTAHGLYWVKGETVANFDRQYNLGRGILLTAVRRYGVRDGLPSDEVTALYEDNAHNLWIGTRRSGVAMMDSGHSKVVVKEFTDLALSKSINAIRGDKSGNVWIATTDGAFRVAGGTGETAYFSTRNGLAHNNIYDIFPDSKGNLWFSTHTNRITVFDGHNFKLMNVTQDGEVSNVNCISEDKQGVVWLGTDGMGLYAYDGQVFRNYSDRDGILSNYIYFIEVDPQGNLWLAHRKGFTRHVVRTGKFIPYPNKTYFPFEENPLLASMTDRNGNIWYASNMGLIRYNWVPARMVPILPITSITNIEIAGMDGKPFSGIELPYGSYRIRFDYLGLTFLDQEDVRYQYKLEGMAPEWSDLTDEASVTFQGLDNGNYSFVVRACNVNGECNETPATFNFRILPPFWETWWFRLLMVLAVAAIIFGYVRYRTYRLNREKAALEAKVADRTAELQAEKEKVEHANIELEKLSLVASKTDNAVLILDKEGRLIWVNDGFTRLTGYTLETKRASLPSQNLLLNSSNPDIRNLLHRSPIGSISLQYESLLPTVSDDPVWVISTLTTVLDEHGDLRNIIIIDSNITERKLAEEKIQRMNQELERLVEARTQQLRHENEEHIKTAERLKVINSELDTFVYRASHDLKGPLASLMGLIGIASEELNGNELADRYLGLMTRAGKRLDGILTDLIEATQVKQGAVEFTEIEVRPFIEHLIEGLSNRTDFAKMNFELNVPEGLKVVSDAKLLTSILENYIDNSIKYRDTHKEVSLSRISVELADGMIELAVQDDGPGIPPDLQPRVFDMFFRGTKLGTGSGLGLYIVQQAAQKLGGLVKMESVEGVGSTFAATIPNRKLEDIAEAQQA